MFNKKIFYWLILSGDYVHSTTEVEIDKDGNINMQIIRRRDQEKKESETKKEIGERYRQNSDVTMT